MANEIKEELQEKKEEEVKEEIKEEESESKDSFLGRMKQKFMPGTSIVESESEEETKEEKETEAESIKETEEEAKEEAGETIDNSFVEAALKVNWTEDEIIDFAENYTNEELKGLISYLPSVEVPTKVEEKVEEVKEVVESKEDSLASLLKDEKVAEVLKPLLDKLDVNQKELDSLKEGLGTVQLEKQVREAVSMQTMADGFFDKTSNPVFGKTEELPRFPDGRIVPFGPAFEARAKVWDHANKLASSGMEFDRAMKDALAWYKGKFLEKDVQNKVVKDLKRNEKRLSPKRTEKHIQKKYATETEMKTDIVVEAARKAGMKV